MYDDHTFLDSERSDAVVELEALESEKRVAEQKLAALQASGEDARKDINNVDAELIAAAMEKQGATDSQMYKRAKVMAEGKIDPMPTSFPAAPYSISVA